MIDKKLKPLSLGNIKPKGWLLEMLSREINGFSGHLDELTKACNSGIFFENKVSEEDIISWWDGESTGNWMEGLVQAAYLADIDWAKEKVNSFVENVLKYQSEDGYIGVYEEGYRYKSKRNCGELFCQSRIFLVLLNYYELVKDKRVLDAVISAADLTLSKYGPLANNESYFNKCIPAVTGGTAHGLMICEPLFKLYELTNDYKYIEFAEFCYMDYSKYTNTDMNSDMILSKVLDENKMFIGHGAHVCEHLRIPILLYYYTKKDTYKKAFEAGFKKIKDCIGLAGACRCDEQVGLPLPTAGAEYCAITELLISLQEAFSILEKNEYADMAEFLMFNAAQANKHHDGKAIAYCSCENITHADDKPCHRFDYSPTHEETAVCCNPNACRITPYFIKNLVMVEDNDIIIPFYAPCEAVYDINNNNIKISIETNYPFDGEVNINVTSESPMNIRLKLRIPNWANNSTININAEKVDKDDNKYYVIEIKNSVKENIVIDFERHFEFVQSIDNRYALKRGPFIYSLKIEEEKEITKTYDVKGFYDTNYLAKTLPEECYYILEKDLNKIFRFEKTDNQSNYFWEESPQYITAKMLSYFRNKIIDIKLIPIGCTILRLTAFNSVSKDFDYCKVISDGKWVGEALEVGEVLNKD